jgi:hypothetical protein
MKKDTNKDGYADASYKKACRKIPTDLKFSWCTSFNPSATPKVWADDDSCPVFFL